MKFDVCVNIQKALKNSEFEVRLKNVTKEVFDRLYHSLGSEFTKWHSHTTTVTNNKFRTTYVNKIAVGTVLKQTHYKKDTPYFRVSVSSEIDQDPSKTVITGHIRDRRRTTYDHVSEKWRVELTVIDDTYEAEIEFNTVDAEFVAETVERVLTMAHGPVYAMLPFPIEQPVNYERNHPFVDPVITPKYNGTRCTLVNHREHGSWKVDSHGFPSRTPRIFDFYGIVDCEMMPTGPVLLDILDRSECYRDRLRYLNKSGLPVARIVESRDEIERIVNDPFTYDGVVIVDNNGVKKYKFKLPEALTIDFQIFRVSKNLFSLMCTTSNDERSLFTGSNRHYFTGVQEVPKGINNSIYEMRWNANLKMFVIVRERPDKTYPNSAFVARSVWRDINNPITLEEFMGFFQF